MHITQLLALLPGIKSASCSEATIHSHTAAAAVQVHKCVNVWHHAMKHFSWVPQTSIQIAKKLSLCVFVCPFHYTLVIKLHTALGRQPTARRMARQGFRLIGTLQHSPNDLCAVPSKVSTPKRPKSKRGNRFVDFLKTP